MTADDHEAMAERIRMALHDIGENPAAVSVRADGPWVCTFDIAGPYVAPESAWRALSIACDTFQMCFECWMNGRGKSCAVGRSFVMDCGRSANTTGHRG